MRSLSLLVLCLSVAAVLSCAAADDTLPLDHWAYSDLALLESAGLLSFFPAAWIGAGHSLTRHECAYYVREAILRLAQVEERANHAGAGTPVETALGRLVAEFLPELRALGVNVEPWTKDYGRPIYLDLDSLLSAISHRPEVPPAKAPPGSSENDGGPPGGELSPPPIVLGGNDTYLIGPMNSLRIPLTDFSNYPNSLVKLAGEVLGVEWTVDLASEPYQDVLGMPLHIGGFIISSERATSDQPSIQSGVALTLGEQTRLDFNALLFLDLDQAQVAMNMLLLDVSTKVELGERLDVFGGLSLEYRMNPTFIYYTGSQATAGVRYLLGENLYLIAEYSLANPFSPDQPHLQGPAVGLSLGDIGLILLGLKTTNISSPESLELSGLFIYRY